MFVPSALLKQLYTFGSLENTERGVQFGIKNRLSDATVTEVLKVSIGGSAMPLEEVELRDSDGNRYGATAISKDNALTFPLREALTVQTAHPSLPKGKHSIEIVVRAKPFGKLKLSVEDSLRAQEEDLTRVPRDASDNYCDAAIEERQRFVENYAGVELKHVPHFTFPAHSVEGNCESLVGAAQIPLGVAGPIHVNGEEAQGKFLVPLATTEGTLVASYNRGIKVVNLSGGARCTVVGDAMQRAPVFVFTSGREARDFVDWVHEHMHRIREEAEATSSVAKLQYVDPYLANKFAYLRFNYSTGDAAGQNMVGRATFAACGWILDNYDGIEHFYLESNFATDKKASQVNIMRTRGKRVTAEVVVKREVLEQHMRVVPESLAYHWGVATVGAFFSGANNNGAHSPNAITAMFIATGQDVANVAESSAGILYSEVTDDGDLYTSLTIPSLIVATYGGGTSLATQRECLEMMGCYGKGKVRKLAEIIAGVALAGELSLGAAISSSDWVSSHEAYGRNR